MAKKTPAKPTEQQSEAKRLYDEGQLARTDRRSIEQAPYPTDDPQRVEWERGWLEQRKAECQSESVLYACQQVGVTTGLADLDHLTERQAIDLLDWIDYAPIDEHDGDATAAWLARIPFTLR